MTFLERKANKTKRNWASYEKKTYAIVQNIDRLDYLLCVTTSTHGFTDGRNLLYVFARLMLRPNSLRHVLSKVHRWAIKSYRFELISNSTDG